MSESNPRVTVEDVRKLALPLVTRVVAGEGLLLNRVVSWTTVIYPEDWVSNKTLQKDELVLVAPNETGTNQKL